MRPVPGQRLTVAHRGLRRTAPPSARAGDQCSNQDQDDPDHPAQQHSTRLRERPRHRNPGRRQRQTRPQIGQVGPLIR